MSAQTSMDGTTECLRIKGELTIYRAGELKDLFIGTCSGKSRVEFDLSSVTEIDTAGVQLLMAAKRQLDQAGGSLHLVGHSQAVIDAFELFDLVAYFGDPLVIAPARGTEPSFS